VYDNEDSGIQFYNGAANNVAVNNLAYNNGDHGIDALSSTGNAIVSNSIHGNFTSGITLVTGSTGSVVRNNIVADNGTTKRGDLWVDTASSSGTSLDYDLVNQSGPGTLITWGGTKYSTVSAFTTATGNESHGLQADPNWANPGNADFHLTAGSPAIDSADSGTPQETSSDMAGAARIDDPATPNTGAGPRAFDDRGALEYQPPGVDAPPVAALTVTPDSGIAPLQVTADASGSTDTDATPIATYRFNFGDGTTVGPQLGSSAQHTYNNAGSWTVTVTVTDTALNHSDATKQVTASSFIEYVTNPGFETDLTGWNHSGKISTLTRVGTTSHGGSFSALVSNPSSSPISCGLVDAPNWVKPSATGTYTATLWVRARTAGKALKLTLAETKGRTKIGSNAAHITLSTSWQQVTVDYTALHPGHSTIGLAASIAKAPHGACFNADDASVRRH
jgi:hypothetical protein